MSDATKQAVQRFVSALLALLAPVLVTLAASPELRDLVFGTLPATVAGIVWLLVPPLLLAIAKAIHGPTEIPAPGPAQRDGIRSRRRFIAGKPPGLFG